MSTGTFDRSFWATPGLKSNPWTNGDWKARAKIVAEKYIAPNSVVLDLGCGAMHLEKFLKDCEYHPSDIARRDERTLICDLENDAIPDVEGVTHVACLGVLPQLTKQEESLNKMLEYVKTRGSRLLLSHKMCAAAAISERVVRRCFDTYGMKYHKVLIVKTGIAEDFLFINEEENIL